MASISGNVYEDSTFFDFIALAYDCESFSLAGSASVLNGTFTISGLSQKKYYVVVRPVVGSVWTPLTEKVSGNYVYPTNFKDNPFVFYGPVISGDPHWNKVELLLHFEGTVGTFSYTDSSSFSRTITKSGSPVLVNDFKFGTTSTFVSSADVLLSPALNFGTSDFTIEFWMKILTAPATGYGIPIMEVGQGTEGSAGLAVEYFNAGGNRSLWIRNAYSNIAGCPAVLNSSENTWIHVAVVRTGGLTKAVVNGNSWSGNLSGNADIGSKILRLGSYTGQWLQGYAFRMDEFRATIGVCRYPIDLNFSPPTKEFRRYLATGYTEPMWPSSVGESVLDDDIVWINQGRMIQPVVQGPLWAT